MSTLPSCLQEYALEDELLAAAYEATPAPYRAWIKTTLALVHAVYKEQASLSIQHHFWPDAGFAHEQTARPHPWALFGLSSSFAAPTRLAAALMAARLAHCEPVLVRVAEQGSFPNALLTAAELTGVSQIASLTQKQWLHVVAEQAHMPLVLFDDAEHGLQKSLQVQDLSRIIWYDTPPTFGIAHDMIDKDALCWAHPDARIMSLQTRMNEQASLPVYFDAVFHAPPHKPALPDGVRARLFLPCQGEGALTGAWLGPSVARFQQREHSLRFEPCPLE